MASHIRNIGNKSIVLDLLCKDESGTLFNVEIQRADNDNLQKRMRYYVSNIDTKSAEEGKSYSELPDIYSIMISEFDIFKKDKTVYHIDRVQYFKEEQEGIKQMTSYSEELRAEGRAEGIAQGVVQGRAEGIADTLKVLGISREEYERKLAEQQAAQLAD